MGEYCSACDVGLCEFCGHGCVCPHVRPLSVLFAGLDQDDVALVA
jgi:hypothetical protein